MPACAPRAESEMMAMTISRRIALLIAVTALVAAWGVTAQPAPGKARRRFINSGPPVPTRRTSQRFQAGMAELGYVEGRNLEIVFRWAEQRPDRLPTLANELVG
jgi:putative ABC transport system substrate-binding protein